MYCNWYPYVMTIIEVPQQNVIIIVMVMNGYENGVNGQLDDDIKYRRQRNTGREEQALKLH